MILERKFCRKDRRDNTICPFMSIGDTDFIRCQADKCMAWLVDVEFEEANPGE